MQTPWNSTRYDSTMAMRISIAVAFLFARFPCFFRRLPGLINRSNPYVVHRSYLIRVSYKVYKSKTRGKGVNNKNLCVIRGLTPFRTVPILYCRFRTVTYVLNRNLSRWHEADAYRHSGLQNKSQFWLRLYNPRCLRRFLYYENICSVCNFYKRSNILQTDDPRFATRNVANHELQTMQIARNWRSTTIF